MRRAALWTLGISFALAAPGTASADSITVDGQRLENVLVTKTSSFYYIQIPGEGRTLNVPIDQIDEASVQINKDPFYRDELQTRYKENHERRENDEEIVVDPAFRAGSETIGSGSGSDAGVPGGASAAPAGGGLGVPRTQLESMLAGMLGQTFQPGPGRNGQPSVVAQMPDGSRVELLGPPEQLHGVIASGTGAPAQIKMMMQQLGMLVMQLQPAAASALPALTQEAEQSGSARKSVGGVTLSMTQTKQGENAAAVEFSMISGG